MIASHWKYSVGSAAQKVSKFYTLLRKSIAVLKKETERISPHRVDGVVANSAATVRLLGLHSVPSDVLALYWGVCKRCGSNLESGHDVVSFKLTRNFAARKFWCSICSFLIYKYNWYCKSIVLLLTRLYDCRHQSILHVYSCLLSLNFE